jgi:hypothetical protein
MVCVFPLFNSLCCAGILEQSLEARNRVEIGLPYRPAMLHRLAESIPWNRFLGSLKVKKKTVSDISILYKWGCGKFEEHVEPFSRVKF